MTVATTAVAAGPIVQRWNTLQILKAGRLLIVTVVALLLIAIISGARVHLAAMKTVGKDSAPSIIAAQHIKSALADMDANAANELLGSPGAVTEAVKAYEARRVEAANALLNGAENITYGESERDPIRSLLNGMLAYERLMQTARDFHRQGNTQFVAAYREAARLMDQTLLPAADALDKANNEVLERAYSSQARKSAAARALIVMTGLLTLFTLVAMQFFLNQRTRRIFNPFLLLASLLAFGLMNYSLTAMGAEQHLLKTAKEDAFDSIHMLWRARAVAYQANAEESRFLLDPANAAEHERVFQAEAKRLADVPAGTNVQQLVPRHGGDRVIPGLSGYLAEELNNITFPNEAAAASETLTRFENYLSVDSRMRALERDGKHREAVELCLGSAPGQSDWAFAQFDQALGSTLEINQREFDESVAKGLSALSGFEIKASVLAVLIAVFTFLGLAARIREYQ